MGIAKATWLYARRLLRFRITKLILLLIFIISILDVLRIHRNVAAGEEDAALSKPTHPPPGLRVYIAGMHWNSGVVLRAHWIAALIHLVETLGPNNVFVSIYESGSWDDTKDLLRYLDHQLEVKGVPRHIEVDDETHEDVIKKAIEAGEFISDPKGEPAVRRIPYLAKMRNKTLKDLVDLEEKGTHFDKVLFLNDVVFTTADVLNLIETNGGKYAAACSLDFKNPPYYYDTFALRDAQGDAGISASWPYFRNGLSRDRLMQNHEAVPVSSCWNGIVAMPVEPFVSPTKKLQFRGIENSLARFHLEGSECCLIHADNPLTRDLGVYVNPRVRVGYDVTAYERANPSNGMWLSSFSIFWGIWTNRLSGWLVWVYEDTLVKSRVRKRLRQWEKESPDNHEPGDFCLINEMQVIVWNGWAHV